MIAYKIGILLLIKNLKLEIPDVTHPWYSDDVRDLGTLSRLKTYFDLILRQGPGRGYHSTQVLPALTRTGQPYSGDHMGRRPSFPRGT